MGDASCQKIALESLSWLLGQTEEVKNGQRIAVPIGQDGWYICDGEKARYSQQPVDVAMTILATSRAFKITAKKNWFDAAKRWHGWFYGANSEGINMVNVAEGWCKDGLHKESANTSHGAETVIMYLMAELEMIKLERLASSQQSA